MHNRSAFLIPDELDVYLHVSSSSLKQDESRPSSFCLQKMISFPLLILSIAFIWLAVEGIPIPLCCNVSLSQYNLCSAMFTLR